jgi:hypothetical protein
VTARVSRIKQEKQAWEDKAELSKNAHTELNSIKEYIDDYSKASMELDKVTMDTSILNPQDAAKAYSKVIRNNTNLNKLFQKSYLANVRPEGSINGIVKNKDKSAITFSGKAYKDVSYDPSTKKIVRPDMTPALDPATGTMVMRPTADVEYEMMERSNPEMIDRLVERAGSAAQFIPELQRRKTIFNMAVDNLPFDVKQTYVKPPAEKKQKEVAPAMSTKSFKVTLPNGTNINAISAGRKVVAQISPTEKGVITGIAKDANGDYYGNVSYKKGTNIVWGDEETLPDGGVDTRWTKITTPKNEFEIDLGESAINAYKGKLGAQFVAGFKSLAKPKGGAPAPEKKPAANVPTPPNNPTAVAFKTKTGRSFTENMVYEIMKAGGFKETREQVINRLSK